LLGAELGSSGLPKGIVGGFTNETKKKKKKQRGNISTALNHRGLETKYLKRAENRKKRKRAEEFAYHVGVSEKGTRSFSTYRGRTFSETENEVD